MSHNNYFTTIKRRVHPHINNHADPPVSYPKTENHQIFFSRPTSIGSDSNQILLKYPPKFFSKGPGITPHTFVQNPPKSSFNRGNSSILYQNTCVNSDNSEAPEKSFRTAPAPPPLLNPLA